MTSRTGVSRLPTAIVIAAVLGMIAHGRIPQFAGYHAFADQRTWLGVPHASDVLSNGGFALVGLWGLWRVCRHRRITLDEKTAPGSLLFVAALVMTAAGSAFYHLEPDDARLVWDRLPIALGCAGLLAAIRAEAPARHHPRLFLGILVVGAMGSVWWWQWTNARGQDDLRPYLLLQAFPLVLVPLWQWEANAPAARRRAFGGAIGLYAVAKLCELYDRELFTALGLISGHTIKHLIAAAAAAIIAREMATGRADPHSSRRVGDGFSRTLVRSI